MFVGKIAQFALPRTPDENNFELHLYAAGLLTTASDTENLALASASLNG